MDITINLYNYDLNQILDTLSDEFELLYNYSKHVITLRKEQTDIGYVRLPLHFEYNTETNSINKNNQPIIYISIESDNAAICLFEGEELIYHTTFSAYMTRKKQGYSQIKHLNKKGKSRAGSRIRLAETETFFENINETLQTLFQEENINRIALSVSKTLVPYVYSSKVKCPFEKDNPQLYKIPVHISKSNHEGVMGAVKKLKATTLFCDKETKDELFELIESI